MILYEHPFSERTRYMIRLEYLFKRLFAFSHNPSPETQHITFDALFEILDVCDRGDCRNWILQEIEKQRTGLEHQRVLPHANRERIDDKISTLEKAAHTLASSNKLGSHIRENEWLMSLRNRFWTPGATSPMDLPAYTAWLHRQASERMTVMQSLIDPYMPLYHAICLVLEGIREAQVPTQAMTDATGLYEQSLGGQTYHILRIWVPKGLGLYPEISANKYILMLRFFRITEHFKHQTLDSRVPFTMALCQL